MSTTVDRDPAFLVGLVRELSKLRSEASWVEFKQNMALLEDIGEYLSALSNAAALEGKSHAYLVWGIEDGTHALVGTKFDPTTAKKGNEELESWLLRQLNPPPAFSLLQGGGRWTTHRAAGGPSCQW